MLALPVDVDQVLPNRLQIAQPYGTPVDPAHVVAAVPDLARQDQHVRVLVLQRIWLKQGVDACPLFRRQVKDALDRAQLCIRADDAGVSAPAQQKADRIDDDRFAGPGLSREYVKAWSEADVDPLDDGEIGDRKFS